MSSKERKEVYPNIYTYIFKKKIMEA